MSIFNVIEKPRCSPIEQGKIKMIKIEFKPRCSGTHFQCIDKLTIPSHWCCCFPISSMYMNRGKIRGP